MMAGLPVVFPRTSASMMPSAMPAPKASGNDSMRATTAMASMGSSVIGPLDATPGFTPSNGADSM